MNIKFIRIAEFLYLKFDFLYIDNFLNYISPSDYKYDIGKRAKEI